MQRKIKTGEEKECRGFPFPSLVWIAWEMVSAFILLFDYSSPSCIIINILVKVLKLKVILDWLERQSERSVEMQS